MPNKPKTDASAPPPWSGKLFAFAPMAGPHLLQSCTAQQQMLQAAEAFSKAWFKRRNQAMDATLSSLRKISAKEASPADAVQEVIGWQQASARRLAEDMQDWVALCSCCMGHVAEAEVQAGQEGIDQITRQTLANGTSVHATPV